MSAYYTLISFVHTVVTADAHTLDTTRLQYHKFSCRLWDKALHVEVEWTVGPIPIEDKRGKEVVLRYSSSLDSGQTYSCTCQADFQTGTVCWVAGYLFSAPWYSHVDGAGPYHRIALHAQS